MSTVAVRTPCCGEWIRVAVQPSRIGIDTEAHGLIITFDMQRVAHECTRPVAPKDRRVLTHTQKDCWCGMPHRREDFL